MNLNIVFLTLFFKGLLNSLCTAAVVMAWTAVFVALLFLLLKLLNLLKVSKEEELRGKSEKKTFSDKNMDFVKSGIDLYQHGEPAYALRIYCAACGEQLQGKTIEAETPGAGGRTNFPAIVTDAEGGTYIKFDFD